MKENSIVTLILDLLKRPGLVSINRVEDFNFIIVGFLFSKNEQQNANIQVIDEFGKFVLQSFELGDNISWVKAIRFYSGDDKHSIQLFDKLFREYLIENELLPK